MLNKMKLKVARAINFIVTITYIIKSDHIEQSFNFVVDNKKYLPYAFDDRYVLKRKLDELYKKYSLDLFIKKVDFEDKVVIYYSLQDICMKPELVNMNFYLPPYNGCLFCNKAVKKDGFIFCPEKNKHYDSLGIKSCKVFSSIEEVLT